MGLGLVLFYPFVQLEHLDITDAGLPPRCHKPQPAAFSSDVECVPKISDQGGWTIFKTYKVICTLWQ